MKRSKVDFYFWLVSPTIFSKIKVDSTLGMLPRASKSCSALNCAEKWLVRITLLSRLALCFFFMKRNYTGTCKKVNQATTKKWLELLMRLSKHPCFSRRGNTQDFSRQSWSDHPSF
jgi:hypothetical protein